MQSQYNLVRQCLLNLLNAFVDRACCMCEPDRQRYQVDAFVDYLFDVHIVVN